MSTYERALSTCNSSSPKPDLAPGLKAPIPNLLTSWIKYLRSGQVGSRFEVLSVTVKLKGCMYHKCASSLNNVGPKLSRLRYKFRAEFPLTRSQKSRRPAVSLCSASDPRTGSDNFRRLRRIVPYEPTYPGFSDLHGSGRHPVYKHIVITLNLFVCTAS